MKPLIELYQTILEDFKKGNHLFICNTIEWSKLRKGEQELLLDHFHNQYPSETQYTEFYKLKLFIKDNCYGSWFRNYTTFLNEKPNELSSYQVRIKLLEAIIENLENK